MMQLHLNVMQVLDGSDSRDYVQRVEPSPQGGAKMARALMDVILGSTGSPRSDDPLLDDSDSYGRAPADAQILR